ncbi:MAG: DUF748 domain-containing protein, partial [bacterium]
MNKILRILLILAITLSFFTCGASPNNSNQKSGDLKDILLGEISKALGREVTAEHIRGVLLYQIVFEDVKIAKDKKVKDGIIATAKKIAVNYNPIKLGLNSNEPLKAIESIVIRDADITVIRNKNGDINLASIAPPAEESTGPFKPFFLGNIHLDNCQVNYFDYKGNTPSPPEKPFKATLSGINGKVDFKNNGDLKININSDILTSDNKSDIKIKGEYNLASQKYGLSINANKISIGDWGNYLALAPEIAFYSGSANAKINIANKKDKLSINGKIDLANTGLSYANYKIDNIRGNIYLQQNQVSLDNFYVEYIGIPISIQGKIADLADPKFDLVVSSNNINLSNITKTVPELKDASFSGKSSLALNISGTAKHPKANGNINFQNAVINNQKISGLISLDYENNKA